MVRRERAKPHTSLRSRDFRGTCRRNVGDGGLRSYILLSVGLDGVLRSRCNVLVSVRGENNFGRPLFVFWWYDIMY